jgi:hypothetical protein
MKAREEERRKKRENLIFSAHSVLFYVSVHEEISEVFIVHSENPVDR